MKSTWRIENAASIILQRLANTPLPGVTEEAIEKITLVLNDYKAVQTSQTGTQKDASTDRKNFDGIMKAIAANRRTIQFAVEAEWPGSDPANAPIRREFQLHPTRVFKG